MHSKWWPLLLAQSLGLLSPSCSTRRAGFCWLFRLFISCTRGLFCSNPKVSQVKRKAVQPGFPAGCYFSTVQGSCSRPVNAGSHFPAPWAPEEVTVPERGQVLLLLFGTISKIHFVYEKSVFTMSCIYFTLYGK